MFAVQFRQPELAETNALIYMDEAWRVLLKYFPHVDEYSRAQVALRLRRLTFQTAGKAVWKMTDHELLAWVENREMPEWLPGYLGLGEPAEY